ncbi:MAG TPA: helix-turn-helix domain-containing protein [Egibacteraceae bacterium]|nr:helix-turn-helix domain-containing protein [Egibacteraceae bacterium]
MADETPDDYPPVLDAAHVARLLNLNIDYVRKLSRQGVLPAHRLPGGRTFRYFKDEILDWLRSQPVHADAEAGSDELAKRRGDRD